MADDIKATTASEPKKEMSVYRILKSRLDRAMHNQRDWLRDGEQVERFVYGSQWGSEIAAQLSPENGWIRRSLNKMKPLATGIISQVAFQNPQAMALPLRRESSFIQKATVDATYLNRCIEEARFDKHQRMAAKDALFFGNGYLEVGTDPHKENISTVAHRKVGDVYFDPDATCYEDAQWVAVRQTMNLHTARKVYNAPELTPARNAETDNVEAGSGRPNSEVSNSTLSQTAGSEFASGTEKTPAVEDVRITVWRIWLRQEALDFSAEVTVDKDDVEGDDRLRKMLKDEGNRVITITEDLMTGTDGILSNKPWPFVIEKNHLPVSIITLSDQSGRLFNQSELEPLVKLQQTLNMCYSFLLTEAYCTAKIKFIADESVISMQDQVSELIRSNEVGNVVGVPGGAMNMQKLELGSLNQAMLQLLELTNREFDEISGFQEIFGGLQGARSATEASIREGRSQTLSSDMRQSFERCIAQVMRHMLQIAYSTADTNTVANWVGREEMGFVDRSTGEPLAPDASMDDMKKAMSMYWNEKMSATEIRRENNIMLVPGSTRRVNPDREIQDLIQVLTLQQQLYSTYQQQGYRIKPEPLVRKMNYIQKRLLKAIGLVDFKQIEITADDVQFEPAMIGQDPTAQINQAREDGRQEMVDEQQASEEEIVAALTELFMAQRGLTEEQAQAEVAKLSAAERQALFTALNERGAPAQ